MENAERFEKRNSETGKNIPSGRKIKLTDQMIRTSRSITANIAGRAGVSGLDI